MMSPAQVEIPLVQLAHGRDLALPAYATPGAAGMDLRAAIEGQMEIGPGERAAVPTGLAVAVPPGFEAQIRPRSGLALQYGLGVLNAPGTIDSDYRGEVRVILANHGKEPVRLQRGDRIAQMLVAPVARVSWRTTDELPSTDRGAGGFGHTGH